MHVPLVKQFTISTPNSGQATLRIKARIRITKVNGNSVTNCTIPSNGGNYIDLTTETSGSLTGVRFSGGLGADLVATVSLGAAAGGGICGTPNLTAITNHYGLPSSGSVRLFGVDIDPSNLSGNGC